MNSVDRRDATPACRAEQSPSRGLADPSRGSCGVSRGRRADGGPRVRQSGARGGGGRLRAMARSLARRDADAVVHEPDLAPRDPRRVAVADAGGKAAVTGSLPAITISSARTTTLSASIRCARCFRRCCNSTIRTRRGWSRNLRAKRCSTWRTLRTCGNAGGEPVAARIRGCGRAGPARKAARTASTRRSPSATSCTVVGRVKTVAIEGELVVRLDCASSASGT